MIGIGSVGGTGGLCGNQNFTARSCRIIVSSSTPSTRRLLDGVAMPVPRRSTEPGRPRAPDTLVDFHTGPDGQKAPARGALLAWRRPGLPLAPPAARPDVHQ